MKKTFVFVMLIAIMTVASPVSSQTIVKGNVVNQRGESVEYVSIGFENDSVGVISETIVLASSQTQKDTLNLRFQLDGKMNYHSATYRISPQRFPTRNMLKMTNSPLC